MRYYNCPACQANSPHNGELPDMLKNCPSCARNTRFGDWTLDIVLSIESCERNIQLARKHLKSLITEREELQSLCSHRFAMGFGCLDCGYKRVKSMITPREWLEKPNGLTRTPGHPTYLNTHPTNLEVLAELVYKNEGEMLLVHGFGNVVSGVGPYGAMGLTLEEALLLMGMHGLVEGLHLGLGLASDELVNVIQQEIYRVEQACLAMFGEPEPDSGIEALDSGIEALDNGVEDLVNGVEDGYQTYVSKPSVIKARQFKGVGFEGVQQDVNGFYVTPTQGTRVPLEMFDWVIPESDGSGYYPCANHIFERKYVLQ